MQENIDKSNMLGIIKSMPGQIRQSYASDPNIALKETPKSIIICGMGGSSIAGQILEGYLKNISTNTPVFNIQDYELPNHSRTNSLIFIVSYSGNSEEAISCYKQALKCDSQIIAIASGGKLRELSSLAKKPFIQVPGNIQPRNAIAFLFFPMIKILEHSGIIPDQSGIIKNLITSLEKTGNAVEKIAKEISGKLYQKLPIIYSSDRLITAAYRFKTQINENAKCPCYCNKFPELNHNELNGYANYKNLKLPMHIIMLKDEEDSKRIIKRMQITKKMIKKLSNDEIGFTEINIVGEHTLTRIFTCIYLCDMISYYLALKYSTDPSPVELIETFKKELGTFI
jgi:glucose/mannose-6-phosphate isomerase